MKEAQRTAGMKQSRLDLDALRSAADQAAHLLKTLANPARLLLLCQMTQGEFCVGELEAITGIRQPTLSQQLTVLRADGMVATRRDGKQIFYRIASDEALQVLQTLYGIYCGHDGSPKETPHDH